MYRLTPSDAELMASFVSERFDGVDCLDWLTKPDNILLVDGEDAAAFESKTGFHEGHYFFTSRGKEAVKAASSFLTEFFEYGNTLVGITPLEYLGARWLNRRIGLKSRGIVRIETGPAELFILTKKEYNDGWYFWRK